MASEWFVHRLEKLGFSSYDAYLQSDHWKQFSIDYRSTPDLPQACVCCGNDQFQLHHTTYQRLGHEAFEDVYPLCRLCHELVHAVNKKHSIPLSELGKSIRVIKNGPYFMPKFKKLTKKNSTRSQRQTQSRQRTRLRREIVEAEVKNCILINCEKCGRRAWQGGEFCPMCGLPATVIKKRHQGRR